MSVGFFLRGCDQLCAMTQASAVADERRRGSILTPGPIVELSVMLRR